MAFFDPAAAPTGNLKDKVIVLTGGATGIGAAAVSHLYSLGAKIVFGDVNVSDADSLVHTLAQRSSSAEDPGVDFLQCDVRSHSDNLALFKLAMKKYGRVDHAVANAGIMEQEKWFDPALGIEGVVRDPGDFTILDINLKGVVLFARIACQYLAYGNGEAKADKSIVFLSSLAGFLGTPGIPLYQVSKHGILGLMRSLRGITWNQFHHLRVNAICPAFVRTGMTKPFEGIWLAKGLPFNEPYDVAKLIAGLCAAGPGSRCLTIPSREQSSEESSSSTAEGMLQWDLGNQGMHGRAIYIEGGKSWEIEEGLDLTMSLWMGKEPLERMQENQKTAGRVQDWLKPQAK
jgi:NAD(P)-dependent dehydrogenase (short-subunit alcohol dehydrogenase family)